MRNAGGAAALEFALVATPVIFLILAALELGLILTMSSALDSATTTVARQIRLGQMQQTGVSSASSIVQAICSNMGWQAADCTSNLAVDVESYSSFSGATPNNPVVNGTFTPNNLSFNMGGPGDIVLIKAYYQWKILTPFLNSGFSSLSNGTTLIVSTSMFRNENFVSS